MSILARPAATCDPTERILSWWQHSPRTTPPGLIAEAKATKQRKPKRSKAS